MRKPLLRRIPRTSRFPNDSRDQSPSLLFSRYSSATLSLFAFVSYAHTCTSICISAQQFTRDSGHVLDALRACTAAMQSRPHELSPCKQREGVGHEPWCGGSARLLTLVKTCAKLALSGKPAAAPFSEAGHHESYAHERASPYSYACSKFLSRWTWKMTKFAFSGKAW